MKIAIAGGTGFVGKALTDELLSQNHEVFILTRKKNANSGIRNLHFVPWLTEEAEPWEQFKDTDVFLNLAGESINSGRWTTERKKRILESRLQSTRELLDIFRKMDRKPRVLINASAIGYYGTSDSKTFTEDDCIAGTDFLATTVKDWEQIALEAHSLGIRTVLCRFGIILARSEGALTRIALPYWFLAGGKVGSGRQWVSWIHIDDVVRGILFAINHEQLSGPVNFTAPEPVTMNEFGWKLGAVIHRPHWLPAPAFAIKLLLGEMSTLVLQGQRVQPVKLIESGFKFQYPELSFALKNIFS